MEDTCTANYLYLLENLVPFLFHSSLASSDISLPTLFMSSSISKRRRVTHEN